ncbi:hypothetical protein CLOM_g5379 [Closterium sp. NIES-68]|nr:hypothetical protein CLOM_g5379 [Closterium sp. NIES-68]
MEPRAGVRVERVEAGGSGEEAEGEGTEASPRLPKADSHSRAAHEAVARILEDAPLEGGEGGEGGEGSAELAGAGGTGAVSEMAWSDMGLGRSSRSKFGPVGWQEYFDEEEYVTMTNGDVFHVYRAGRTGPVLLCLHGGGYTGLSFAVAAGHMKGEVQVVALDMRGHGGTRTTNDSDLSAQTLVADVAAMAKRLFGDSPPAIVLLGHSMGGAVAVRVAEQHLLPSLAGLVVVDVVEGTALASLGHMHAVLASRPSHFPSLEKAVEWSVRSGHLRSVDSARVSVPSTLVPDAAGKGFTWRTPLEQSQPYWKGWYTGLSDLFLHCPVPKLLLLAGTDRLDKPLTIAQMQGRFQMLVVRHSGHAIQEDETLDFSSSVLHFIARNRITQRGVMVGGFIHH